VKGILPLFALLAINLPAPPAAGAPQESAETKAWRIVVPQFELKDASVEDGIRALQAKSRALDPAHEGVNFVQAATVPADKRLNLHLVNVPLREVARYVARLAGLQLAARQNALIFQPAEGPPAPVSSRVNQVVVVASQLVLPRVEFRDASLPSAFSYLETAGRNADPRKVGVNIVLDVPPETRELRLTLSLTRVPFYDALRYAAEQANLVIIEEPYALVITPAAPKP
jgi:hypothetical protein